MITIFNKTEQIYHKGIAWLDGRGTEFSAAHGQEDGVDGELGQEDGGAGLLAGFLKNPDGSHGLEQFGIYLCHLSWGKEMLHGVAKKTYRCIFSFYLYASMTFPSLSPSGGSRQAMAPTQTIGST